jgi:hypothetical protein
MAGAGAARALHLRCAGYRRLGGVPETLQAHWPTSQAEADCNVSRWKGQTTSRSCSITWSSEIRNALTWGSSLSANEMTT